MSKGTELPEEGKDLGLGFQLRNQHFGVTQTWLECWLWYSKAVRPQANWLSEEPFLNKEKDTVQCSIK
jgi:hypothetical protein